MYRIRRQTIVTLLPPSLLIVAFGFVFFGIPPVFPVRTETHWPYVPLVSVAPGTTPDVWSSVPGLLHVSFSAFQCVLLVETARLAWVVSKSMNVERFLATFVYEAALVFDMFRLWGRDWLVWVLYQLHLGRLCSSVTPCFPISGVVPWISLSALGLALASLMIKPMTPGSTPGLPSGTG
jgi:hypothetical protein